ncbi:Transporter of the ATP-binding cassette (ABC), partial [Coemansia furcata]
MLASEQVPLLSSSHVNASVVESSWRMALRRILRLVLSLAAATALFSAYQALREFQPDDRHGHQCTQLLDDCFRLGIVWPAINIALGIAAQVSLLLLPSSPSHSDNSNSRHLNKAAFNLGGVKVSFRDNRQCMAAAAVGVSLVGAAVPLAFLRVSASAIQGSVTLVHEYHQVYWKSHMAFWISAFLALTHGLLTRSYSGAASTCPAFHWLLVLAVVLQLSLSALAEGYFNFFTGSHIYEPVLFSLHSRFVLVSVIVSVAATLVQLNTHRRGFYQLDAQLTASEHKQVAAAIDREYDDDYTTPLTRMRAGKAPLLATPEHHSSFFDRFSLGWIAPIMNLGSKVQLGSGDLCRLDAGDRPLANWRRFARHYKPGHSLVWALARTFWRYIAAINVLSISSTVLGFGGTFFMQRILRSIRL